MVGELETIEPTVRLRSAPCLEDDKWEVIVESSGLSSTLALSTTLRPNSSITGFSTRRRISGTMTNRTMIVSSSPCRGRVSRKTCSR